MRKPQQPRHCAGWLSWCGWVYFLAMAGVQNCVKVMSASVDSMGKYSARLDGSVKLLNLSMISAFSARKFRSTCRTSTNILPSVCCAACYSFLAPMSFQVRASGVSDFWLLPPGWKWLGLIRLPRWFGGHLQTRFLYTIVDDSMLDFIVLRKYMKDMKVYPSLLQVHRVWVKTIQNLPPAKNIPSTSSNKKYARECS